MIDFNISWGYDFIIKVDVQEGIKMKEYTGVDALMIGRAACGNPWLFDELNAYFEKGEIIEKPTKEEIINTMLDHTRRLITLKGEHVALVEMRTHAAWYLKQLIGTKSYKPLVVSVSNFEELCVLAKEIINNPLIVPKK